MKRSNNFASIFHLAIITLFLFSFSGCGYKAPPFYTPDASKEDANVKFTVKKQKVTDINSSESCE